MKGRLRHEKYHVEIKLTNEWRPLWYDKSLRVYIIVTKPDHANLYAKVVAEEVKEKYEKKNQQYKVRVRDVSNDEFFKNKINEGTFPD